MSRESLEWLNNNVLIGFTDKRGKAWHYKKSEQGAEPNHYADAIPIGDVRRRLFGWEAIESVKLTATWPDGTQTVITDRKAVGRSDDKEVMGMFADGYNPHQYQEWLLGTVASILDDDLSIGSAGLLKKGAVAWVSVEVPETLHTPEGVDFRPHLLAATSFDGSLKTRFKRATTLTVCDNTLAAALGESGEEYSVKHSKNSHMRLADARDALNVIYEAGDAFAAQVKELCETTVTDRQWKQFLEAHVPMPEEAGPKKTIAEHKRAKLISLWSWDNRVSPWQGTAFGVLQATNTWMHHESTVRGATRPERNMLNVLTGKAGKHDDEVMATLNKVLAAA